MSDTPPLPELKVAAPGEESVADWKDRLAIWVMQRVRIPTMTRVEVYAAFGKAKKKRTRVWGHLEEDDEDSPPRRGRIVTYWSSGVRPHRSLKILRKRALQAWLDQMPVRRMPYRYSGIEVRRPPVMFYMDGV